jgi:hypothetical protein
MRAPGRFSRIQLRIQLTTDSCRFVRPTSRPGSPEYATFTRGIRPPADPRRFVRLRKQLTVNQRVAGSSPASGAISEPKSLVKAGDFGILGPALAGGAVSVSHLVSQKA